jgi:hypothetical protein
MPAAFRLMDIGDFQAVPLNYVCLLDYLFLRHSCNIFFIIDLFNNSRNSILPKWAGERRRRMPEVFFLTGCTG